MNKLSTDKSAVMRELLPLIRERLFGAGPWLAEYETCEAVNRRFEEFGLQYQLPAEGDRISFGLTTLGEELNLELMMVFMGVWDDCEISLILVENDLITELEFNEICFDHPDVSSEVLLRPMVQRAFIQYFRPKLIEQGSSSPEAEESPGRQSPGGEC